MPKQNEAPTTTKMGQATLADISQMLADVSRALERSSEAAKKAHKAAAELDAKVQEIKQTTLRIRREARAAQHPKQKAPGQ